jgi:hypothetical protein
MASLKLKISDFQGSPEEQKIKHVKWYRLKNRLVKTVEEAFASELEEIYARKCPKNGKLFDLTTSTQRKERSDIQYSTSDERPVNSQNLPHYSVPSEVNNPSHNAQYCRTTYYSSISEVHSFSYYNQSQYYHNFSQVDNLSYNDQIPQAVANGLYTEPMPLNNTTQLTESISRKRGRPNSNEMENNNAKKPRTGYVIDNNQRYNNAHNYQPVNIPYNEINPEQQLSRMPAIVETVDQSIPVKEISDRIKVRIDNYGKGRFEARKFDSKFESKVVAALGKKIDFSTHKSMDEDFYITIREAVLINRIANEEIVKITSSDTPLRYSIPSEYDNAQVNAILKAIDQAQKYYNSLNSSKQ